MNSGNWDRVTFPIMTGKYSVFIQSIDFLDRQPAKNKTSLILRLSSGSVASVAGDDALLGSK